MNCFEQFWHFQRQMGVLLAGHPIPITVSDNENEQNISLLSSRFQKVVF